jgi:quinoprotein glucose dehydrogenase
MSGDDELGFAYLPIGTATNDYYGGHRLGHNLFAESLVAVDAETGERQWHFQMVHHGLWDYDNQAAPNLLDITVDGRRVKAVAQVTKQGFVYAFDRVTGEPIWPIEERAVPTDTDLEGEVPSPTQPFPVRPAPFEYQGTSIDDLVDFTPEIRQLAIAAVEGFRLGPLYTPQMLDGTVMRPSVGGGANWSGAAIDPETGFLYVPSVNAHSTIGLSAPEPQEQEQSTLRYLRRSLSAGPVMPRGLPLWKPPYSRMTAIDMNAGEHVWMTPTGNGDRFRNHPMLRDLDLAPLGGDATRAGPLLTRTVLIHALVAGGSDGGPRLVVYDKATGAELASLDLPGGALGAPMTYLLDGTQYIAVTVGGEISGLVAFRLP